MFDISNIVFARLVYTKYLTYLRNIKFTYI
nr:MAG TPA: hypothetical protein [Caudoviricetes sp.]